MAERVPHGPGVRGNGTGKPGAGLGGPVCRGGMWRGVTTVGALSPRELGFPAWDTQMGFRDSTEDFEVMSCTFYRVFKQGTDALKKPLTEAKLCVLFSIFFTLPALLGLFFRLFFFCPTHADLQGRDLLTSTRSP